MSSEEPKESKRRIKRLVKGIFSPTKEDARSSPSASRDDSTRSISRSSLSSSRPGARPISSAYGTSVTSTLAALALANTSLGSSIQPPASTTPTVRVEDIDPLKPGALQRARNLARHELSPEEWEDIDNPQLLSSTTVQVVISEVERARDGWKARKAKLEVGGKEIVLTEVCDNILLGLDKFVRLADPAMQCLPAPGPVVWGVARVLVSIAVKRQEMIQKVHDAIETLTLTTAQCEFYARICETAASAMEDFKQQLEDALPNFYRDLIVFAVRAQNYYAPGKGIGGIFGSKSAALEAAQKKMTESAEKIQKLAGDANMATTQEMKKQLDTIQQGFRGFEGKLDDIHQVVVLQMNEQEKQIFRECRIWLNAIPMLSDSESALEADPEYRRHRDNRRGQEETFSWLQHSQEYQNWLAMHENDSQMHLWISGQPGAGKSVLSSYLLEQISSKQDMVHVVGFFCRDGDVTRQTSAAIVANLVDRLVCLERQALFETLKTAHDASNEKPHCTDFNILWKMFIQMIKICSKPVLIVVDALDECKDHDCFIQHLLDINTATHRVKVCLTSRPWTGIERKLEGNVSRMEMRVPSEVIKGYLQRRFDQSTSPEEFASITAEDKEVILERLPKQADGMFRYAALMLEDIATRAWDDDVGTILDSVPSTLDDVYKHLLTGLHSREKHREDKLRNLQLRKRIYMWIAMAMTPITVSQMVYVCATKDGEDFNPHKKKMRPKDKLLELCGPLVEDYDGCFRFTHHSVKDFLRKSSTDLNTTDHCITECLIEENNAHCLMAITCLQQLCSPAVQLSQLIKNPCDACIKKSQEVQSSQDIAFLGPCSSSPDDKIRMNHPLYYSVVYWILHASAVKNEVNSGLWETTTSFFQKTEKHVSSTLTQWLDVFPTYTIDARGYMRSPGRNCDALHIICSYGLVHVAKKLLDSGSSLQILDDDRQTPLHLAVQHGHLETTRLLVENGADVKAIDINSRTPLHWAARIGHLEMARFLVENGADVKAIDINSRTPLHWAAQEGHLEMARFLVENGADVKAIDNGSSTPLHWAARRGRLETARFLVENGADVKAIDNGSPTPLHWAALGGHLEIARFLVENGADVKAIDNGSRTPLHFAAVEGHLETARFLVENGADVKAIDNDSETPLHWAARRGRLETARFLVEYGADISTVAVDGSTPLSLADKYGHLDTKHLLAEKLGSSADIIASAANQGNE